LKVTEEDLQNFIKFSQYIDKCADWRTSTPVMMDITNLFSWFNELGMKMKSELEAEKAKATKAETATESPENSSLSKLKTAK